MDRSAGSTDGFRPERMLRISQLERWHFWFQGRMHLLVRMMSRHSGGEASPVLEVGCGTGFTMEALRARGWRIVGLDLRIEGLRLARKSIGSPSVAQGSAVALPFADGGFAAALLLDTLEHVDDRRAMEEIRRVLRPGGLVFINVPAHRWLWSFRDAAAGHRRRYGRSDLRALVAQAGLELLEIRAYQFLLFPLMIASRILGRAFPGTRELEEARLPLLNTVFGLFNRAEAILGAVIHWPWGSSFLAAGRKRT